jgi:hypothetical protein
MEDYVNLFWLATRSGVSHLLFCLTVPVSGILEMPKTMIKLRAYLAIADSATGGAGSGGFLGMGGMEWYEVACVVVVTGVSTVYVHGTHMLMAGRKLKRAWAEWRGGGGGGALRDTSGGVAGASREAGMPIAAGIEGDQPYSKGQSPGGGGAGGGAGAGAGGGAGAGAGEVNSLGSALGPKVNL